MTYSCSADKHPVRLWVWSRPHRLAIRKRWLKSDGYATGNQAERLLKAAIETCGDAHVEFYPTDHSAKSKSSPTD